MTMDASDKLRRGAGITYDESRDLARHRDAEIRRLLAERDDVRPEILYFLAEDEAAEVRRAVAGNEATPRQADLMLASDANPEVRVGLAEKIALLAPGLSPDEQDKVRHATYEALEILARDQMTMVRQVVAETLKDVADAPPEVIRRLARDIELAVAGPVLEFSPVLTPDDLLEIIAETPVSGKLSAISRRHAVPGAIADAIAATDDEQAIAALLANKSAQIREETLDALIEKAPERLTWHEPLVRRPKLPKGAARRLACFVARTLVEALVARDDLDPETADAVKAEVDRRIAAHEPGDDADARTPYEEAVRLKETGDLSAATLAAEVHDLDKDTLAARLAVLADLPHAPAARILAARAGKPAVALAWKAGLDMAAAVEIQRKVGLVAGHNLLEAGPDGDFPLTEDEMHWQIELFED